MRSPKALIAVGAWLALAAPDLALAEIDPLGDPAIRRVREAFSVERVALFDRPVPRALRGAACAESAFPGLVWCATATTYETSEAGTYSRTFGYNLDAAGRVVYLVLTRREFPLARASFEETMRTLGARYGRPPTTITFGGKTREGDEFVSVIAFWGEIKLLALSPAELRTVAQGGTLARGHLVDHRQDLRLSARQGDPVYRIEGTAGSIAQFRSVSDVRTDFVLRAVYQPAFAADPAARPEAAPRFRELPLDPGLAHALQRRQIEEERLAALERARRAEAERKAAEARARQAEIDRRAAEERARRIEAERKAAEERRAAEERARREQAERRAARRAAAERQAAEERAQRAEAERKAAEERRAAEDDARRAEAERRPAPGRLDASARPAEAEREATKPAADASTRRAAEPKFADAVPGVGGPETGRAEWLRMAIAQSRNSSASWVLERVRDPISEDLLLRARASFADDARFTLEFAFDCNIGAGKRLKAHVRAFDKKTNAAVPIPPEDGRTSVVRGNVTLDEEGPQTAFLFPERDERQASIVEIPLTHDDVRKNTPRAQVWLRHYRVALKFRVARDEASATIYPYAANLRRVLEACGP